MNLYLIFYGLFTLGILLGGTSTLYNKGITWAAVLFFVGAAFLLGTYGLRWFGSDSAMLSNAPVQWPPVINTCPDYLTFYKRTKAGTKIDTCIDTIGVSRNGTLKRFVMDSGNPPSGDDSYFPLATTSTDTEARNRELCQRAMTNGLTWEGITNGESCILPDGTKSTGTAAATSTCQ